MRSPLRAAHFIAVTLLLVACRDLLSIEDRPLAPEDGGADAEGATADGSVPSSRDASGGDPPVQPGDDGAAPPAVDRAWSRWAVPADFPRTSVVNVEDDVVRDGTTKLMWARALLAESQTFGDAQTACGKLVLSGFSDWRVPTRIELATIVDYQEFSPATDKTSFPDTPSGLVWTASAYASSPTDGWACDFLSGAFGPMPKSSALRVRCVRG